MPQRIQRKRTKGWQMPEGAIYVGRPSRSALQVCQRSLEEVHPVAEHAEARVALVAERSAVLNVFQRVVVIPAKSFRGPANFARCTHFRFLCGAIGEFVRPRSSIRLCPATESLATVAWRYASRAANRTHGRACDRVNFRQPVAEFLGGGSAFDLAGPQLAVVARNTEPARPYRLSTPCFGAHCRLLNRDYRHD